MKKIIGLILIFTVILTTTGCSKSDNLSDDKIPSSSSLETSIEDEFIHDDVIALFTKEKETDDYVLLESVIVEDDKMPPLKAVILFYDKDANNGSNLAFIVENSVEEIILQEITFAVNEVEGLKDYDSSGLTYKGNGAVTISGYKSDTNESLNFTVIYSHEESTSSTNFKIISEKS